MAEETIVAICQFGGGFVSDGRGTMSYTGGEAHALDISRGMKLHDFKSEISDMFKINSNTISINCFNSKQSLIKISSDKDLKEMVDSNIDSGTIDIYISIEADNRTRVADSGTSIAEAAANVGSPDSRKTCKRTRVADSGTSIAEAAANVGSPDSRKTSKRTRVTDSGISIAEAAANVGSPDSRKTSKRTTRTSVSPSVKPLELGEGGAGSGAGVGGNTGKTAKRKTRSSVSPSVEALRSAGAGAGRNTGKTTKRITRPSVSPIEAMKSGGGGADASTDAGRNTGNTTKRVTRSNVSPSVEAMKSGDGVAATDPGGSTQKTKKRVTRSSVSPSVEVMKPGNGGANADAGQSMAEKLLCVAEKLISAENLVGSKKLALDALEYDPLVEGADQIIAVTDVLLAAQRRINNQVDWYAVLQLDPATSGRDPHTVRQHYRRLTLLLRPGRSPLPAAADASRIVADAWAILSDPSKKSRLDAELNSAMDLPLGAGPSEPLGPTVAADPTFWTTCSFCFHMHQYFRAYEGRCLQCQNCRHAFLATALTAAPPVVPGTDMYYCSWGFFPLGFSSGVQVGNTSLHAVPPSPIPMKVGNLGGLLPHADGDKGKAMGPERTALPKKLPPATNRKTAAKKTTRNNSKKRVLVADPEAVRPAAATVVADPEAKGGAARPVAVGPENSAAVVADPEAKSGAVTPVATKSGAAEPVAVGPENSAAVVADHEARSGAARLVAESGAARLVRPENSAVPEAKSRAARLVAVRLENSAAVVADPEAKNGAARPVAVGPENSAAVVVEPVAFEPEHCDAVVAVVVEPEAKSEAGRPVAVRPEYCVGVAVAAKAAPVVLDLNEEAGFWETQDTGLMMDQDQDHDLASFDFDLDAVDLDAAGDLLGQFN